MQHTTFAIRIDGHPVIPFADQLDENTTLGKLQKILGASEHFVSWCVPGTPEITSKQWDQWFSLTHGTSSGVNYGVSALTTAR